jgi:hypothetical protein
MEDQYPGMWHRWFLQQCAAVGWPPAEGYHLTGPTKGGRGWSDARNRLNKVAVGDRVIVALRDHRVGRIGEVVGKAVEDDEWAPLVERGPGIPSGEMGRRIILRWNLDVGPASRDQVVLLPSELRFTAGEVRATIREVRSFSIAALEDVMRDETHWVGLLASFRYERALSEFIAAYPHRLEDGMLPYPNEKVRERVFPDRTRLDVLLIDKEQCPVIVECKQHGPTIHDIEQLRHYMQLFRKEVQKSPRGVLVHGGARKLREDVRKAAQKEPVVEIVQYRLDVEFTPSA